MPESHIILKAFIQMGEEKTLLNPILTSVRDGMLLSFAPLAVKTHLEQFSAPFTIENCMKPGAHLTSSRKGATIQSVPLSES